MFSLEVLNDKYRDKYRYKNARTINIVIKMPNVMRLITCTA
ncbi:hypothetical protein LTSEBAI_3129 [Salmonella enterica subsp. enterica serovar Baildon str. R6-199]|nr:hypothetical protein LTSEBAI_3129 [Salmonella enterica subsp. enterica serovar Baildon str. R6-199]